jgi:hypothetical protein
VHCVLLLCRSLLWCALLGALSVSPALACDFDHAPSSHWSVAVDHGVDWLKTPCGDRFYSLGVNILDGGYPEREQDGKVYYSWQAFSPTLPDWIAATHRRLRHWGFNSGGGWSLPPQQLRLPTVIDLELGRHAKFHWFDPFAPETERRMMAIAEESVAPFRGSPYRIGYFSDNEVGWWAGALFGYYSVQPAAWYTKQRWVALLRRHYGDDWARFTADFQPPEGVDSWDQLLATEELTVLRPDGHGISAVREWTGIVAERYYNLAERAIRAADPEALYFGDRLPIYYDPAAVKAMAPHVDAIATNYNVDAGDGWLARYYFDGLEQLSGNKPVLVTEWFFAARENRTGNRNNGHLMTVGTQAERARGAAAATRNFAALPEIVGAQWFQYYDHPKGGRSDGEDYNFGLVDIDDRPYEQLTEALAAANRAAPAIHAAALPAVAKPGAPIVERARPRARHDRPGLFRHRAVPLSGQLPAERRLPARDRARFRRWGAPLHAVLHPAQDQTARLSGNAGIALRRRGRAGDRPGLRAGRRGRGGLFRRRPAAHHRRIAAALVGPRRRAAATGRVIARRGGDDFMAPRALDVLIRRDARAGDGRSIALAGDAARRRAGGDCARFFSRRSRMS